MNNVKILNLSYGNYISLEDYAKLQQENNALIQTHNYDIEMIDKVKGDCVKLSQENQQLENKLKQRDEVIEEAIDYINFLAIGSEGIIDMINTSVLGYKKFNKTIWGEELLETLQKYKGDNNE